MLPGYLIVAGSGHAEGAIITRNATGGNQTDVWPLRVPTGAAERADDGTAHAGGAADVDDEKRAGADDDDGWFRLETNYDHWEAPPAKDDRRDPAIRGMRKLDGKPTFEGLWNVLSTHPVYNPSTIHTDVVFPAQGDYRTYARHYPK